MTIETNYLDITWSTSRGRNTYGDNICKATDSRGRAFRTCGGGYDMVGTVVADWLCATYQDRLLEVKERAGSLWDGVTYATQKDAAGRQLPNTLYGMTWNFGEGAKKGENVHIDGACGVETVVRIAEQIGVSLSSARHRNGRLTGFMVTDYGSPEAMRQAAA